MIITKKELITLRKKYKVEGDRISTDIVKDIIKEKGGSVGSKFRYYSTTSEFFVTCQKGHKFKTFWSNIQQGRWCPFCIKVDEKKIRLYIENKKGHLDKNLKYKNSKTRIGVICNKGHKWKAFWSNIKKGHWCPFCAKQRVNEKDIRKYIEEKKGVLNKDWKYLNCHSKFKVICSKGHKWETSWSNLQARHWCPKCSCKGPSKLSPEHIKNFIENKGGSLDKNWIYKRSDKKFLVSCKSGHKWRSTWDTIKQDYWCPYCARQRINKTDVIKFIKAKKGIIGKNWKYKNCNEKFNVICHKGHNWKTNWNNIKQGCWCPTCQEPICENKFRKIIENYFKEKFPKKRPEWLRYPKTNRPLELDGYNRKLKIAFEYQGYQHYYPSFLDKYNKIHLKERQFRDNFKIKKCKEMGIILITVPYWIPESKWIALIKENGGPV